MVDDTSQVSLAPMTIDIETLWNDQYSLKKMSTYEYITDPRFFIIAVGVYAAGNSSNWVAETDDVSMEHEKLKQFLIQCEYTNRSLVAAHNGAFDFPAIRMATGLVPRRMTCTMMLAVYRWGQADVGGRYTKYAGGTNSLGSVYNRLVRHPTYQAGKDKSALVSVKGRSPSAFTRQERVDFMKYLHEDVRMCSTILETLYMGVPSIRTYAIHWALRNLCEPQLMFDAVAADTAQREREVHIQSELARFMVDPKAMTSREKFKEAVEIYLGKDQWPDVITPAGNVVPLFSKSDDLWNEMLTAPSTPQPVKDLMNLRVAVSAASRDKRIDRYITISRRLCGYFPIHVLPSGAHTHRPTGGSGSGGNPLNMPQEGVVRRAVHAPPGCCLLVFDFTGIELRVCRWGARDTVAIEATLGGIDLYVATAADALGKKQSDVTDKERFAGKITQLAAQYGTGAKTLAASIGVPYDVALRFVSTFRKVKHAPVANCWNLCEQLLILWSTHTREQWSNDMAAFFTHHMDIPAVVGYEKIKWPSGTTLYYDNMQAGVKILDSGQQVAEYKYRQRHKEGSPRGIYGPLLFENIIQSLANEIMWDKQLRIERETGLQVALQVYDEIVCVVPDDLAQDKFVQVHKILTDPVDWWPGQPPLGAEGTLVRTYAEAK